jgi:colicin import membrane protein
VSEKGALTKPISISAGIHIGFIVILALGISFDDEPKFMPQAPSAPAVQAVLVDQQKVNDRAEELKQQKRDNERKEQQRLAELERKAQEARQAREQEQAKIKTLEVERQQKELETLKANEAAKLSKIKQQQEKEKAQKAETERKQIEQQRKASEDAAKKDAEKRKQDEAAAVKKAELERKQREDDRKRKEDAERKRKAEADTKARQEQEMADAMADEHAALSQTRNKQVLSEVDKYSGMIKATIQRNLIVDESMRTKTCKVFIRLANDGFVTSSQTLEGDPVMCRAVKNAINKAGRLPVSPEADVYNQMREINLIISLDNN